VTGKAATGIGSDDNARESRQRHPLVDAAVGKWPEFADQAGVSAQRVEEISRNMRRLEQLRAS
jgi:hypothetical protein